MQFRRHTTGLLLVAVLAAVGYGLVTLPPTVIAQYKAAAELSPTWSYVYLAAVGLGALLLGGAAGWMILKLWQNTRRKQRERERRLRSPSQLSRQEQEEELRENLAAGGDFFSGEKISSEDREELQRNVNEIEQRLTRDRLEIVAFGTISSGKSSLLNALAGREMFRSDPRGGTTLVKSEIPWPGNDRVILVDTPGLAEVQGEARAAESAAAAKDADLVLFVVDGPLKAYEIELLRRLRAMEKRVLVCLNKEDWFSQEDRRRLIGQMASQAESLIAEDDMVSVRSRPTVRRRIRVMPDGSEAMEEVTTEPDIGPLAARMMEIVSRDGRDLLVANLLLQSRGLVEKSKEQVRAALDRRANELVSKYMWAAGGAAAVNPIPLLDLAGGSAITVKMVLDLARVYRQTIDVDTVVHLLGQLTKNLIAMLGVTAATPAVASLLASAFKTVPGIGTIAGGLLQGLVQALVANWIGRVFIAYFRAGMTAPPGGIAELAREKWSEVTRPEELLKLVQAGRRRLGETRQRDV